MGEESLLVAAGKEAGNLLVVVVVVAAAAAAAAVVVGVMFEVDNEVVVNDEDGADAGGRGFTGSVSGIMVS